MPPETLFARWREANHLANESERKLFEATMAYVSGAGPKPSDQEMARAVQLREHARQLFQQALAEVDVMADSARRGIVRSRSSGSNDTSPPA